ncbi:MAG: hypothetical protein KU38_09435 [Sulfurovum sp. FS08-3]|nr:MAG: hypothetical protein KU38_09435 [Sulfurovum sp. FS08-3]
MVAVKQWGNSLALRIPKDIATTLLIEDNSLVELIVKEKTLTIKPTTTHLLKYWCCVCYNFSIKKGDRFS